MRIIILVGVLVIPLGIVSRMKPGLTKNILFGGGFASCMLVAYFYGIEDGKRANP